MDAILDRAVHAFEQLVEASSALDRAIAAGAPRPTVQECSQGVERAAIALAEAVRFLPADQQHAYRERTDHLLTERIPPDDPT